MIYVMRTLIISLDRNILGLPGAFGDAAERHKLYGKYVDSLDIIVMNRGKAEVKKLSDEVRAYPTNSLSRFFYFWDAYKIGKKIYNKRKFDLVVCQDPFLTGLSGYLLKKKTGCKLIVHSHGDFFGNFYWLKENWFNFPFVLIGNFVIQRADAIRAVSKGVAENFIKMGFKREKIYQISTPVDLNKFSNYNKNKVQEIRKKYERKKIVFFVGRLVQAKNISLLIDSFQEALLEYKDAVLLIAGSGEQKQELEEKIKNEKLENNIFLLGAIDHNDLPSYYRVCDFFVLPSTNESFGKVLLEAAAAGKTSVASKTLGAQEIIKDGETGFIVPINDKNELKNKILKLLTGDELRKRMGDSARENAYNEYGFEKNTEKIINMWRKIANN